MKRPLLMLASFCACVAFVTYAAKHGVIARIRSDRIAQPYELELYDPPAAGGEPLKTPPVSIAALGPGLDEVQFKVTNTSDLPLTYWGWFENEPIIRRDELREGHWKRGDGPMCGTGMRPLVLQPGKTVKIVERLRKQRRRSRYFVNFTGPDKTTSAVFLGEYFPN